jgi:hypothetical protein
VELHPKVDIVRDEYLSPILSCVNRYLIGSIQGGRIRDLDSVMSTIAMVMAVLLHSSLSKVVDGWGASHFNSRDAAQEYTKVLVGDASFKYAGPCATISTNSCAPSDD